MKLRGTPKNSIGVSDSKILIDATMEPWGYEEMRSPDEKVTQCRSIPRHLCKRSADCGRRTADCGLWTADWV